MDIKFYFVNIVHTAYTGIVNDDEIQSSAVSGHVILIVAVIDIRSVYFEVFNGKKSLFCSFTLGIDPQTCFVVQLGFIDFLN